MFWLSETDSVVKCSIIWAGPLAERKLMASMRCRMRFMRRKLFRGGTAYVGLRMKSSRMATSALYAGAVFRVSGGRLLRCGFIPRIGDCVLVVGKRIALGGSDDGIYKLVSQSDSTHIGLNHRILS